MTSSTTPPTHPIQVVCVDDQVLLPGLFVTLTAAEGGALLQGLFQGAGGEKHILCVPQPSGGGQIEAKTGDVGCLAKLIRLVHQAGSTPTAPSGYLCTFQGVARAVIKEVVGTTPWMMVKTMPMKEATEVAGLGEEVKELQRLAQTLLSRLTSHQIISPVMRRSVERLIGSPGTSPSDLVDLLAGVADGGYEERVGILREASTSRRVHLVMAVMRRRLEDLPPLETSRGREGGGRLIGTRSGRAHEGSGEQTEEGEVEGLRRRVKGADLPPEVRKEAEREVTKLARLPPTSMERGMIVSYLEWVLDTPWLKLSEGTEPIDLDAAQARLDADHTGLEEVKKRIIEYLAVLRLRGGEVSHGPILCLVGPPGVGKTSLGRSIAEALGKPFGRVSLGGVRDEAEVRGHRRTYVSSMPGTVVRQLRRAGVKDPVMLLDEIDKVGKEPGRGDPSSALLEVLDPEQNGTFTDHYLGLPLDLSKVLFIATANRVEGIPEALLDRMEVIHLPGYTIGEKVEIGLRHLLPKQLSLHGLSLAALFGEGGGREMMEEVVGGWTREAGVRELERCISALCRWVAVREVRGEGAGEERITVDILEDILGPRKYDEEEVRSVIPAPGLATGLAYMRSGSGGVLFIESARMPGQGKLLITGQLGEVMEESARIALSWIRANARDLGVGLSGPGTEPRDLLEGRDLHIHCPAGAVKKDGPSAGVALVISILSTLRGQSVDVGTAMTGEVTLRGEVLPVGGIREKLTGARRAGVRRVLLPRKNEADVRVGGADLLGEGPDALEVVYISRVEEAVSLLFGEGTMGQGLLPGRITSHL